MGNQLVNEKTTTESHRVTHLARMVFATFVLTFVAARILVLLIMTRHMPDLFLHVGGTHVHHLNYGIFLLSAVGAYMLFARPTGFIESVSAVVYGIGLGLTFDEFGMWLHLGGPYWQRASFDAVVVISAVFGLIAYAPTVSRFTVNHWFLTAAMLGMLILFSSLTFRVWRHQSERIKNGLEKIEANSPS